MAPPKATIRQLSPSESPSQAAVTAAADVKFQVDAKGRRIGVVKPSALMRYRLLKILGAENAKNEMVLGNAMLAFLVREINGEQIMAPNSDRQIEALIDRLDDEGLAAVAVCLAEQHGMNTAVEDVEENVKNS